jgi:integrase
VARLIEALERIPRGFGQTPVLLSRTGGRVELETFRHRHWNPALAALKDAGLEHRGVYACRHTFATWSIRAGVDLFHLSRVMGTSLRMIDKTYGHLAPDAHSYIGGKLDTYDDQVAAGDLKEAPNG